MIVNILLRLLTEARETPGQSTGQSFIELLLRPVIGGYVRPLAWLVLIGKCLVVSAA